MHYDFVTSRAPRRFASFLNLLHNPCNNLLTWKKKNAWKKNLHFVSSKILWFPRPVTKIRNIRRHWTVLSFDIVENSTSQWIEHSFQILWIFHSRIKTVCLGSKCKIAVAISFDLLTYDSVLISSESLVSHNFPDRKRWPVEYPEIWCNCIQYNKGGLRTENMNELRTTVMPL